MSRNDWLISIAAVLVYLIACTWHLSLPGLQYDESIFAAQAVNFIRGTSNAEPLQITPSVIHLFGRPLPVMTMSYIGPVKTLLHIPIFALFGISATTVRLAPILVMLCCFPLMLYLCKQLFNSTVAFTAVALIALDPSFVFYLTRDFTPAALQVFLKLVALVFFTLWWKRTTMWFFFAGMFSLGVGVLHRVDFLWVVGGIALAAGLTLRKGLRRRMTLKTTAGGFLAFCIGALPMIVFNIVTGGFTFAPHLQKVSGELLEFSMINFLGVRVKQLLTMLNGEHLARLFTGESIETGVVMIVVPAIFGITTVGTIWLLLAKKLNGLRTATIGLWIFILSVLVVSCFSPTVLAERHLLVLYPMIHVSVAVFLAAIIAAFPLARKIHVEKGGILVILLANFIAVSSINSRLETTGGVDSWSDAIYDLSDYLEQKAKPVAAMDWGFTNNLIVLTKGTLAIDRVYADVWKKIDLQKRLEETLNDTTLYLFHAEEFSVFPSLHETFLRAASSRGYTVRLDKEFFQKDGRTIYLIYRLEHP